MVDELAQHFQGKIKVGKMDVDRNSATPMRYKVTGIPTLLVFKGGQVVESWSATGRKMPFSKRWKSILDKLSALSFQFKKRRPAEMPGASFGFNDYLSRGKLFPS